MSLCQVCGLKANGSHFGAESVCRACSAFWRRSHVRKLDYTCKTGGKCAIQKGLRKACSKCRFEKCKEIGMTADGIRLFSDLNGPLRSSKRADLMPTDTPPSSAKADSLPSSSANTPTLAVDSLTTLKLSEALTSLNEPILSLLNAGVSEYFEGEKNLYIMLYDEVPQAHYPIRRITHRELIVLEKGCLPLIESMIVKWCPGFEHLDSDVKATFFRSFHSVWSPLQKCFLTSLVVNPPYPIFFQFHYGVCAVPDDVFYCADDRPEEAERFSEPMRLGVDHIFKRDVMNSFRNRIFEELHANLRVAYSPEETGTRMAALIGLLQESELVGREVREAVTMRRLSNKGMLVELWDD
ncbi:hypothetical protein M3Y99_01015900 [Aphelenchoides fujianensis]|nr:hypothetical protein M3Y99_01015900 [Aphelenchoides fujianensis]